MTFTFISVSATIERASRRRIVNIINLIPITIAVVSGALLWWFIRRAVLKGSGDRSVTVEEVRAIVATMNFRAKQQLASLHTQYAPEVVFDVFASVAVAVALAAKQEVALLSGDFVLTEHLDSLSRVGIIILIEKLTGLEISDGDAEYLLTFEELATYVNSRAAEIAAAE